MRLSDYKKRMSIFRNLRPLVLASRSPRRRELLGALGIEFEIVPSYFEEPSPDNQSPEEYVKFLAREKAREVSHRIFGKAILAADTIVVLENKILGKPSNEVEAQEMLMALSGKIHEVFTAYTILFGSAEISRIVKTQVVFKELNDAEIKAYIATGESMDKAGAYAIQGLASYMVKEIHGSVTNVIGLPLNEVIRDLLLLRIIEINQKF